MADDVDTPFAGPMTMQEALDKANSLIDKTTEAKPEEAPQEAMIEDPQEEAEEQTLEAEPDEPETEDEGSQVLTADEYGEVLVDVNGEATPLSELIKGNLRQADYTRKRQADSEAAKAKEAELAEKSAELDAREQQLQQLLAESQEQEPDWEALAEEDPLGWTAEKLKWDRKQAKRQQVAKAAAEKQQSALREFTRQTAQIALEKIPEWSDPEKFDEGARARKDAALAAGFTEQEYASTQDFRFAVLLEKARLYDAQKADKSAKTAAVEKRLAKAPKVLKPGQSKGDSDPSSERRAAFQKRLQKAPITTEDVRKMLGR